MTLSSLYYKDFFKIPVPGRRFSERFHSPVKEIGFNVAVLLMNLSEHMSGESRLERILTRAKAVLDYFTPYLGTQVHVL